MSKSTIALISDAVIDKLPVEVMLQSLIAAGVIPTGSAPDDIKHRFHQVREDARVPEAKSIAEKKDPRPIMPPIRANRKVEIQLPGSSWSHGLSLEATGTYGLVELLPAEHGQLVTAPHQAYQLGVRVTSAPERFGRSKMLVVSHRVTLVNRCASTLRCLRVQCGSPLCALGLKKCASHVHYLSSGCHAVLATKSTACEAPGGFSVQAGACLSTGKAGDSNAFSQFAC